MEQTREKLFLFCLFSVLIATPIGHFATGCLGGQRAYLAQQNTKQCTHSGNTINQKTIENFNWYATTSLAVDTLA